MPTKAVRGETFDRQAAGCFSFTSSILLVKPRGLWRGDATLASVARRMQGAGP